MNTVYRPDLKAHLTVDAHRRVRQIRPVREFPASDQAIPRLVANDYLNEIAPVLQIRKEELKNLSKRVSSLNPREQGVEYHLSEEKRLFDSITVGYAQTYLNVPVWRRGLAVEIKQAPNRVLGVTTNTEDDVQGRLPPVPAVERNRKMCRQLNARNAARDAGLRLATDDDEADRFIREVISPLAPALNRRPEVARLLSGKFFVYKYDPNRRYAGKPAPTAPGQQPVPEEVRTVPIPELPPVPERIKFGQSYLVTEVIGEYDLAGFDGCVWLMLVEVETGAVLYIECMTCGVNGLVFRRDPIVKTGDLTKTADDPNSVLNPLRDDVLLTDLDAPVAGTQQLRGRFVDLEELTISHADPDVAPPTAASGADFDYDARTDNFGAVSAYYHQTELFRTIESLGFPIATYFDGTTFPIQIDHRSLNDEINAHWSPNGAGGTGHMCYGLCDTTNTSEPLLRAVDPWVHWHEMGGHGTLGDHVGSGNLGFSHSAGDGLAALQMDPESALRELGLPERFRYAPFRPNLERRFDRPVATWAWRGTRDDGGYGSEEILATCHFRIYRSIGGDHADLGRRRFASRMTTYLILRTIGSLTPGTNPPSADLWSEQMQVIDLANWTSEGLSGGAYNKVIRWAFEKQGSYQPAGAPTPVTTPGAPPEVDVYIDDGRGGEYPFQAVHWHNMSMWNRTSPDGLPGHQDAVEGVTNYLYGKVKNRGTAAAANVTVRCYHTLPGAGLTWPTDFTEMGPVGGRITPSVGPNSTEEVTVGPFEWVPNVNAFGHDCTLMIASAAGDASNVDHFTAGETVAEWRLVPNDNNIGQRNVALVPGAPERLVAVLNRAVFFARNSFNRPADMELRAELPEVLSRKGWRLTFAELDNNRFRLREGERRSVQLRLVAGEAFTADELRRAEDRDVRVMLSGNGITLGGMTYRLDPDREDLREEGPTTRDGSRDAADRLLDSLNVGGGRRVKQVQVKKISLEIELDQ